jgi:hypothetical protein
MTKISDESGHVLLRNVYDQRLLKRQEFGNGSVYSYNYDWAPNSYYPEKVAVTLPDQRTRELSVADSIPQFIRNLRHH